jgi:hypothetical protein
LRQVERRRRISAQLPPSDCHAGNVAVLGLLSSVAAWLGGAMFLWLVGGLVLGAVIPFTLIVIPPTNKQLLNPTPALHSGGDVMLSLLPTNHKLDVAFLVKADGLIQIQPRQGEPLAFSVQSYVLKLAKLEPVIPH